MSIRAVLISLGAIAAVAIAIPDADAALGDNLLLNPGFEQSVLPVVPTAPGVNQPVMAKEWSFEGNAFFDHTPSDYHSGKYSGAISAPLSGKARTCADPPVGCHDHGPLNTVKTTAAEKAYTVLPAWRPLNGISVQQGKTYNVSGWVAWSYATVQDGGPLTRVRWVDANGVGLGLSTVIDWPSPGDGIFGWRSFQANVVAPPGAVKAVPLFGSRDDAWTTNLRYDDLAFRPVI